MVTRVLVTSIAAFGFLALLIALGLATGAGPPLVPGGAVAEPPPPVEAIFSSSLIGDFGTGSLEARAISRRVDVWTRLNDADLLVTTGDNVYPDGSPRYFEAAWELPYAWVAERPGLQLAAALGNHDVLTNSGTAVMELLMMPDRWYSIVLPGAEVFVLDANDPGNRTQLAWLESALAESASDWQVAVFHQPPFSCSRHGPSLNVRRSWEEVLASGGVDLVLSGHEHNYQRFAERAGVTYVVAGGSGAGLYDIGRCPVGQPRLLAGVDREHSFVGLIGSEDGLYLEAIGTDGRVLDSAWID